MATEALTAVLRSIRHLAGGNGGDDQSDGKLLRQFVAGRDEKAFAAILQRYGPLVFKVCWQVLRNPQDAEDAFQATFLVLARKAGSIRAQAALAAWLHRVALNIARTAKKATAQRQVRERQVAVTSWANPIDEATLPDWQPLLHEEVNRLPEKYRVPVVICYFKEKTHEEAARQLGWPLGTVKGRLARARDLLRKRLARRGLALSTGGLAVALADHAAQGPVPTALLGHTLRAAVPFVGGGTIPSGALSTQAVVLAKGALRTMTTTKLLSVLALTLAIGVAGLAATLGPGRGRDTNPAGWPAANEGRTPLVRGGTPAPPAALQVQPARAEDFGAEVKGLRAKVTLAKKRFKVGEAIPVKYTVKNVSKVEQIVWHSGFWFNHLILVRDAKGKEPPLTVLGQQCRKSFSPGGPRKKNAPVKIPPDREDTAYEQYDLAKLYDLSKPGRYTVQYVYEEKQGGWEGRLPSNTAGFEIAVEEAR
jgi:RNA polymerase sigma factor (sigma-70 family)